MSINEYEINGHTLHHVNNNGNVGGNEMKN